MNWQRLTPSDVEAYRMLASDLYDINYTRNGERYSIQKMVALMSIGHVVGMPIQESLSANALYNTTRGKESTVLIIDYHVLAARLEAHPDYDYETVHSDAQSCTIRIFRRRIDGSVDQADTTMTIEEAQTRGSAGTNPNYRGDNAAKMLWKATLKEAASQHAKGLEVDVSLADMPDAATPLAKLPEPIYTPLVEHVPAASSQVGGAVATDTPAAPPATVGNPQAPPVSSIAPHDLSPTYDKMKARLIQRVNNPAHTPPLSEAGILKSYELLEALFGFKRNPQISLSMQGLLADCNAAEGGS